MQLFILFCGTWQPVNQVPRIGATIHALPRNSERMADALSATLDGVPAIVGKRLAIPALVAIRDHATAAYAATR